MGGLNVVKLAIDMKTERKVALKFLNNKESFMRECSFLKALRSFGDEDDQALVWNDARPAEYRYRLTAGEGGPFRFWSRAN